jgi:CRISPR/Cas system CSM-associated protein Csm4 (group 5 of RAMP superfamily)
MSSFKLIKLKNLTPLHIGTGKENYDFSASELQSDTLSSAIAALRVQHCGDRNTKAFLNSFTISSAFPYIGDHFFSSQDAG